MRVGGCLFNVQQIFKMLRIEKARSEKKNWWSSRYPQIPKPSKTNLFWSDHSEIVQFTHQLSDKKKSGNKRVEMRKKGNTFTQEIKLILIAFNQEIQDIIGWLCFKRRRIAIKVIDDTLS